MNKVATLDRPSDLLEGVVESLSWSPDEVKCEALVRARALEAGLAYELVASRADLTRVVVAARPSGSLSSHHAAQPSRGAPGCEPAPALMGEGSGEYRARTGDLLVANQALSQLS